MVTRNLITGFEPYGGSAFNPSELIVNELALLRDPGVETAVLPTSYQKVEAKIVELIQFHRPAALIMLGLKRGASSLCIERLAANWDNSIAPDNAGDIRIREKIVANAPAHYANTLPFDSLADAAGDMGELVEFSDDAGGYVCNHLYFVAAHMISTRFPDCRYGFVHVPQIQKSSERMARIVNIIRCWSRLLQGDQHGL